MRYRNVQELIQYDEASRAYFESLPENIREALNAHGGGVNNLSELKHFAGIIEARNHGASPNSIIG